MLENSVHHQGDHEKYNHDLRVCRGVQVASLGGAGDTVTRRCSGPHGHAARPRLLQSVSQSVGDDEVDSGRLARPRSTNDQTDVSSHRRACADDYVTDTELKLPPPPRCRD